MLPTAPHLYCSLTARLVPFITETQTQEMSGSLQIRTDLYVVLSQVMIFCN